MRREQESAGSTGIGSREPAVFVVFAAFLLLAAAFTWGLPERRVEPLEERLFSR